MFFLKNKHKSLVEYVEKNNLDRFRKEGTIELITKKFPYENFKDFNLLLLATYLEKIDIVSFILSNFTSIINEHDSDGRTPLHLAIRVNNLELVVILLGAGAKPEFQANVNNNVNLCTQLATTASFEIMKSVIESSDSFKAKKHTVQFTNDMHNHNAANYLRYLHVGLDSKLPPNTDVENEIIKRLEYLNSIGCDLNIRCDLNVSFVVETNGFTHHYMLPIVDNRKRVLEYLLQNNVDPNVENIICGYACDLAVEQQHYELVPVIQMYGGIFAVEEMENTYKEYANKIEKSYHYKIISYDLNDDQKEFITNLFKSYDWPKGFHVLKYEVNENGNEYIIDFLSAKYAAEIKGYNYEVFELDQMIDEEELDENTFSMNSNNIIPYMVYREQFLCTLWSCGLAFETKKVIFVDNYDVKFEAKISKDSDLLHID
jgi:ankyrin repeat protein